MKVLVCGSRYWTSQESITRELARLPRNSVIIHGACRGADSKAAAAAISLGLEARAFPADWRRYGKAAGPIRNRQMLDEQPDLVMAFHRNLRQSTGTADTVREAHRRGIKVRQIRT